MPEKNNDFSSCSSSSSSVTEPDLDYLLCVDDDGEYYAVVGIGDCSDTEIIIKAEVNGIPVRTIAASAFMGNSSITYVFIPDSITDIEDEAFYGCSNLNTVVIPESVLYIGSAAFSNCEALDNIYCEAITQPSGWSEDWTDCLDAAQYWGDSWEYADGVPTPQVPGEMGPMPDDVPPEIDPAPDDTPPEIDPAPDDLPPNTEEPEQDCSHYMNICSSLDLAIYGACEGCTAQVFTCQCETFSIVSATLECIPDNSSANQYYIEEDGTEHTVWNQTCILCGLNFYSDCAVRKNGCTVITQEVVRISMDEQVIIDVVNETVEEVHNFDSTTEMYGQSCTDGYTIMKKCRDCGFVTGQMYYDTHQLEWMDQIQLSAHNTCGGYINHYTCLCGQEENYEIFHNCSLWVYCTDEPDMRDSNGVLHFYYIGECETCGLIVDYDEYSVYYGCNQVVLESATARIGDTILYENVTYIVEERDSHDYNVTIERNGDSCTDGYTRISVCNRCGYTDVVSDNTHTAYLTKLIYLVDVGLCGGWYDRYSCSCGRVHNHHITLYCDHCSTDVQHQWDENGYDEAWHTTTCADCSLLMLEHSYVEVREGVAYHYVDFALYNGDTLIDDPITELIYVSDHETGEWLPWPYGDCRGKYINICPAGNRSGTRISDFLCRINFVMD